jgi:hypothetical protein
MTDIKPGAQLASAVCDTAVKAATALPSSD